MAADADEATPPPPPKKSGGLVMNAVVVFVMALLAVVAGGFINDKLHPMPNLKLGKDGTIVPVAPVAKAGHGEEGSGKASVFYAIDPPLVVNFEDGSVVRFLQITMEIMAHDPKVIESVQKNVPLIRNNLLLLMSNRNYQTLMSRDGKDKLRAEALVEVNNVQKKQGGEAVDDVLFTSFVVQ